MFTNIIIYLTVVSGTSPAVSFIFLVLVLKYCFFSLYQEGPFIIIIIIISSSSSSSIKKKRQKVDSPPTKFVVWLRQINNLLGR